MESKSEEAMKLLAKKIEQAARDSAIKCVEEAEDDQNRFRRWDQIGFFDRITYYKTNEPLYRWKVDTTSIALNHNILNFCMNREYSELFQEIAGEKIDQVQTKLRCTVSILRNGFINILIEDCERNRFRVRDLPGIVERNVFDTSNFDSIKDIKISSENNIISISYSHEDSHLSGFEPDKIDTFTYKYELNISMDNFGLEYFIDGIKRIVIPSGSFIFETSKDSVLLEILLENYIKLKDLKQQNILDRLVLSTKESYEFKNYIETIPFGSSAMAITFNFIQNPESEFPIKLMGICSRIADTVDIKPTIDSKTGERLSEPHRVYNTDHFNDQYPHVSLYGCCPLLYSIENNSSTGIIMLNASDTLVDFTDISHGKKVDWSNESGVFDLFIFNSKSIEYQARKLIEFSGKIPMPLETSLGYNQCRWNYFTQDEVLDLNEKLVEHRIPADFIWLDIEHTDSKIYFTFDREAFPDPEGLLKTLLDTDRQMITQIDPHFKDYRFAEKDAKRKTEALKKLGFYTEELEALDVTDQDLEQREMNMKEHYLAPEAISKRLVVLDVDENDYRIRRCPSPHEFGKCRSFGGTRQRRIRYTGDCWPGSSVWIDYLNLKAQEYFGDQYLKEDHIQSNPHVHIKNDMNEPSVFNPILECTMPKNNIHTVSHYASTDSSEIIVDKFEHRDVHSCYGILMAKSSYEGLIKRKINMDGEDKNVRSFLLSRSFYIGSQKYGTMWIGDSHCKWSHIKLYIPLCTTISLSGFSFCGFDTPAFWQNPTPEFCARGYQIGCLFPFFRAHSDRKAKRREPYLFKSPFKEAMINCVETRYELVIYYYTAFYNHRLTGQAVMRPVFNYDNGKFYNEQVYIGERLMGKGLVHEGMTETEVFFPEYDGGKIWYQRHKSIQYNAGETITLNCEINEDSEVPIFVKGGSIIPEFFDIRKQNIKSLWEIRKKPEAEVRLWIYPDEQGSAIGYLYQDDGFTFDYEQGKYNLYKFEFKSEENKAQITIQFVHKGFEGQLLKWSVIVAGQNNSINAVLDSDAKFEFLIE